MTVRSVVDEEILVGCGDLPIAEVTHVVVVAQVFVRQNVGKGTVAIVLGAPARAFEAATGGELGFGEFVLDQPEAELALMVVVGDGNVAVGASRCGFVAQVAERFIPEFDAEAVIQLIVGETRKVGFELGEDSLGLWMEQDGQEQVEIGRLRAGHVIEVGVDAEGKFLQVCFNSREDGRVECGELIGVSLGQDGVVKDAAIGARFAGDAFPFPVDQVDVHFLLEGILLGWEAIFPPVGLEYLHGIQVVPMGWMQLLLFAALS